MELQCLSHISDIWWRYCFLSLRTLIGSFFQCEELQKMFGSSQDPKLVSVYNIWWKLQLPQVRLKSLFLPCFAHTVFSVYAMGPEMTTDHDNDGDSSLLPFQGFSKSQKTFAITEERWGAFLRPQEKKKTRRKLWKLQKTKTWVRRTKSED